MRVPISWLKDFIDINTTPEDVANRLNLSGLETTITKFGYYIEGLITVEIKDVQKHPQREKLNICKVYDGTELYQVVTADQSVKVGDKVILAKVGTKLPSKDINLVEFAGVKSEGMLISLEDLGLEEKSDTLFILDEDTSLGVDGSELLGLGEEIFEIEITPNRGDCLSVLGVAREVSAIFGFKKKDNIPTLNLLEKDVTIEVLTDDCYRYCGVVIKDVKVKKSPLNIRLKLIKAGLSPINNIVDITNYLLIQEGQPLHAFDLDKIEGRLTVRKAEDGERVITLDSVERVLSKDDVVIADDAKVLALAGVIGGNNSKITDETQNILLEVAVFDPISVRKTSKRLGISTDSSYRFERGIDIERVPIVRDKAVDMILSLAGGKVEGFKDLYIKPYKPSKIILSLQKIEKVLGEKLDSKECEGILNSLDIPTTLVDGALESVVPAHRYLDISRDIDLIEEIARIKGYDSFEPSYPKLSTQSFTLQREFDFFRKTREYFLSNGFTEVVNYTFTSEEFYQKLNLPVPTIKIENYILKSQSVMRDTVFAGLIETVRENLRFGRKDLSIFEISSTFFKDHEEIKVGILASGKLINGYNYTDREIKFSTTKEWDILTFKGVIENYLRSLGLFNFKITKSDKSYLHPYLSFNIEIDGKVVGYVGKLHPKTADQFEIHSNCYISELKLKYVPRILGESSLKDGYIYSCYINKLNPVYRDIPKYPPVKRDIAFVVNVDVKEGEFEEDLKLASEYIYRLRLFDVYRLSEDKKSLAYSVEFISPHRSLSDEEVNSLVDEILDKLKLKYNELTLRS
ncbi:MAG: phenylalanine--tRNA ligase subunit beta [Hydrogenothermaceae bacterium]